MQKNETNLALDVCVCTLELCFALFGPGLFFAANATHYAAACLDSHVRVLLLAAGIIAVGAVAIACAGGRMHLTGFAAYCVVCLHGLLAVFEAHHRVPVALLAVGCLLVVRRDRADAVVAALCAAVASGIVLVVNVIAPLHDNARAEACATVPAAAGLLLAGVLHAFPAALLFAEGEASEARWYAFALALLAHALPLAALSATAVVPVLLRASYVDMLVGGVSTREAGTLAVQAGTQLAVGAAAAWYALAGDPARPAAHYFTSVLVGVAVAFFLLNFSFSVLVPWLAGIAAVMLALSVFGASRL